jgi:hypothetical protein
MRAPHLFVCRLSFCGSKNSEEGAPFKNEWDWDEEKHQTR